ncbi:actin-related protein 2/3 complex subunit 2B-like isoform X3 [Brassica napus]|uniref:actin-related protein 2/3 complex subunit 2B isoform X4 n=1 Tax=Brassica oleracea var. oleracea TaxID=109376 RepID=UPI0006A6F65C|nr:PREDICTED: actin-related protein 2/3 complex subunit 2B isoform X4 [Brassica oleracea var. oleracea]XP_048609585.1 actin-related protein 2/3 complex subunit 2B-like isoform X3 [Brassica napus]
MAYLERSSPTLKETLLKIYRAEKPIEIDQHFYEFGSIQYHIKCSVLDTNIVYVSTSTLLETQGIVTSKEILSATYEVIKNIAVGVIDIVDPPRLGFQLTLKLHLDNIPRGKEAIKIITRISEIQAIILSSQLKEMLKRLNFQDDSQAMNNNNRPVRIVYHPSEPFYVFRQAEKITAVFPMNFKDNSDVVIAMSFFQELVEVGSQKEMGKAPQCSWSPVPPFQLRGEPVHDLTTNAGFVSFDITSRHVEGKRLDKTVWNLLNFYAYVKYHIKCTRGYIQRRMRKRMDSLVKRLNNTRFEEESPQKENGACKYVKELVKVQKGKLMMQQRCKDMTRRVKISKFRIRINGCARFRFNQRWISIPKFSSKSSK